MSTALVLSMDRLPSSLPSRYGILVNCLELGAGGLLLSPLVQPLELGHGTEGGGGLLLLALVQCLHEGQAVVVIVAVHNRGAVVAGRNEAVLTDKHAVEERQVLRPHRDHFL